MVTLGPYETLIIVGAIVILFFGPVLAGVVLAMVRRGQSLFFWRKRPDEDSKEPD